jgi:diadenosine tetraphosphate (Ap4A) HIT family hydrolase
MIFSTDKVEIDGMCFFAHFQRAIPLLEMLETEHALAFLDREPIVEYHSLVIPMTLPGYVQRPEEVLSQTGAAIKQVSACFRKAGIENRHCFNYSGRFARLTFFHLHFHPLRCKHEKLWLVSEAP